MEGKNIKVEDLIDGEYYHADKDKIVFIHDGNKRRDEIGYSYRVQCFNGSGYYSRNGTYGRNGVIESTLRLATNEEKEWLKYAININKYISYEDFLKEYKPTYEKGKWYKLKSLYDWYAKFEKFSDNCWYASEFIDVGDKSYKDRQGHWDWNNTYKSRLVTDLKEIEPYLPKDHPDIQKKPETFVGRYFKALVENARYSNVIKNNYYLIEQEDDLYFRFYTEFSEDSLFCLDKSLSGIYELMPIGWIPSDVIPEYVECLGDNYSYSIKNRIYKIITWKKSNVWAICNIDCDEYKAGQHLCFDDWFKNKHKWKISTKEAYDLQNSKQYPLVPEECYDTEIEVGDYIQYEDKEFYTVESNNPVNLYHHENNTSHYYCQDLKYLNNIKKFRKVGRTTTLDKKVDAISSKVPERLQLKIRETVVENTIEERIKLKLNNLKTIKIKQHVN